MKVTDILKERKTSVSFEFFPPKTDNGWENLYRSIRELLPLKPSYVSVTYGAGGTTRDRTHDLVIKIRREQGLEVVAHLTCVNSTREEINAILAQYEAEGVANILALRGDPPAGSDWSTLQNQQFKYASDLIRQIRHTVPAFGIGVAGFPEGHPATPNRLKEMDHLKEKIDTGADYIVTQLFFDNRDFFDFRERCELAGIKVPIIAGIMPVTSKKTMQRMAELSPHSRFPAALIRAVERAGEDPWVEKAGIQWATEQVRGLIDQGTAGIHFYTLNNSGATLKICDNLGLKDFGQIRTSP
jgi:methylenetetrahydrofolate reductase (NADPH)